MTKRVRTNRGSGGPFAIRRRRITKAHPLPRVVLTFIPGAREKQPRGAGAWTCANAREGVVMRQTDKQGSQGKKAVEFYAALVLALALAAIAGVLYFYAMF